jgi:hypothetical protein
MPLDPAIPMTWIHIPVLGTFVANSAAADLRRNLLAGKEVSVFPLTARGTAEPLPEDLEDHEPLVLLIGPATPFVLTGQVEA